MNLLVFSLLDTKTGRFNTPFFLHHRGEAFRMCMDIASDPNTTVGRHPHDFALCEIGSFDDQSASLSSQIPVNLGLVGQFIDGPAQEPK